MRVVGWVAALALLLTGCSSSTSEGWVVTPIVVDHSIDDRIDEPTDASYYIDRIVDDTAGGFWTESEGSWFHIDAEGMTAARFNTEFQIESFAALSPTELLVSVTGEGLREFDTQTQVLTPSPLSSAGADAIAISSRGQIAIARKETRAWRIVELSDDGGERDLAVLDALLTGDDLAMDVSPVGDVVIATRRGLSTVTSDGELHWEKRLWEGTPLVEIDDDGATILRAERTARRSETAFWIGGGSDYAREVLGHPFDDRSGPEGPLTISRDGQSTVLDFTTGAVAALATGDGSFIVIRTGWEGDESLLAHVQPPPA